MDTNHQPLNLRTALMPALALLLIAGSHAWAQADVSGELETIRTNRHMVGLSAMAIKGGRILAQGAAGFRRQGQSAPLLVTDRINIASCTKWMTATIAGRLVDRGVITWDIRVCDLFTNYPAFNPAFTNATLDQFLCHRSGVQQYSTFRTKHESQFLLQHGSLPQLRRWVSEVVLTDPPEVTPGSYLYANQGYTVAASMMEIASGKDWETLMRDEIFFPLRMSSARLGIAYDHTLPPSAPVGHTLAEGSTNPVPWSAVGTNSLFHYQASLGPGGFVVCTLQDWAKFLHLHMTSDLGDHLSAATALRLQQPYAGAEGYGRGIKALYRDNWASPGKALTHTGDVFGHDTVVWMAPARDFIVVVFTNCRSSDKSTENALEDVSSLLVGRYKDAVAAGPLLERTVLLSPRRVDNDLAFDFSTLSGVWYAVETSPDLASWTPANGTNGQTACSLQTSFIDTKPAAKKFYRVKAGQ